MSDKRPLSGIIILEQVSGNMGMPSKMLAELGAQVIRLEPPQGAADRRYAVEKSKLIDFQLINAGKESVLLRMDDPQTECLLQKSHALIFSPDIGTPLNINVAEFRRKYPRLLLVSISGFGANSRLNHHQISEAVISALTGELSRSGYGLNNPLVPPEGLTMGCAATQALFVIITGLYDCLSSASGRFIDFSLLEGAYQALDPGFAITGNAAMGATVEMLARARPTLSGYPTLNCSDGRIRLCILSRQQWRGMLSWMGSPEQFSGPEFYTISGRFESSDLMRFMQDFFSSLRTDEAVRQAKNWHVPCAKVRNLTEAINNEHTKQRGCFTYQEIAEGISIHMPNGLVTIDGVRMSTPNLAPEPGQHTDLYSITERYNLKKPANHNRTRPLQGLRVLDLGIIVVGSDTGKLLADLGADVIKIEDYNHPDGSRGDSDMSWSFHLGHRNKRSLGINLKSEEGLNLFLKLSRNADVILSNYKPGTMEKLGLSYEIVSKTNNRIIMVDSSAFGSTGPWSDRMGYGPLVRAETGLTSLWSYAGEQQNGDLLTIYPDHSGARIGAACVIALLIRRLTSTHGGTASVAQSEIVLHHLASLIAHKEAGIVKVDSDIPSGIFRCRGYDEWIAITVKNGEEFIKLAEIIDKSKTEISAYSTPADRQNNRLYIENVLRRWLFCVSPDDAVAELQHAGIAAAHMQRAQDLPAMGHFVDRNFFREEINPLLPGKIIIAERQPFISDIALDIPDRPAPTLGQDTCDIARNELNLAEEKIAELISHNILEPYHAMRTKR